MHNVYTVKGDSSTLPWEMRVFSKTGFCDGRMLETCDSLKKGCISLAADPCACQIAYGECLAAAQCLTGTIKEEFDQACADSECQCGISGSCNPFAAANCSLEMAACVQTQPLCECYAQWTSCLTSSHCLIGAVADVMKQGCAAAGCKACGASGCQYANIPSCMLSFEGCLRTGTATRCECMHSLEACLVSMDCVSTPFGGYVDVMCSVFDCDGTCGAMMPAPGSQAVVPSEACSAVDQGFCAARMATCMARHKGQTPCVCFEESATCLAAVGCIEEDPVMKIYGQACTSMGCCVSPLHPCTTDVELACMMAHPLHNCTDQAALQGCFREHNCMGGEWQQATSMACMMQCPNGTETDCGREPVVVTPRAPGTGCDPNVVSVCVLDLARCDAAVTADAMVGVAGTSQCACMERFSSCLATVPDCDTYGTLAESLRRSFAPLCNSSLYVTPECNLAAASMCAVRTMSCMERMTMDYPDACACLDFSRQCMSEAKCLGVEMANIENFACQMQQCNNPDRYYPAPYYPPEYTPKVYECAPITPLPAATDLCFSTGLKCYSDFTQCFLQSDPCTCYKNAVKCFNATAGCWPDNAMLNTIVAGEMEVCSALYPANCSVPALSRCMANQIPYPEYPAWNFTGSSYDEYLAYRAWYDTQVSEYLVHWKVWYVASHRLTLSCLRENHCMGGMVQNIYSMQCNWAWPRNSEAAWNATWVAECPGMIAADGTDCVTLVTTVAEKLGTCITAVIGEGATGLGPCQCYSEAREALLSHPVCPLSSSFVQSLLSIADQLCTVTGLPATCNPIYLPGTLDFYTQCLRYNMDTPCRCLANATRWLEEAGCLGGPIQPATWGGVKECGIVVPEVPVSKDYCTLASMVECSVNVSAVIQDVIKKLANVTQEGTIPSIDMCFELRRLGTCLDEHSCLGRNNSLIAVASTAVFESACKLTGCCGPVPGVPPAPTGNKTCDLISIGVAFGKMMASISQGAGRGRIECGAFEGLMAAFNGTGCDDLLPVAKRALAIGCQFTDCDSSICSLLDPVPSLVSPGHCDPGAALSCSATFGQCVASPGHSTCSCVESLHTCLEMAGCQNVTAAQEGDTFQQVMLEVLAATSAQLGCAWTGEGQQTPMGGCSIIGAVQCISLIPQCQQQTSVEDMCGCFANETACMQQVGCGQTSFALPVAQLEATLCAVPWPTLPLPAPGSPCQVAFIEEALLSLETCVASGRNSTCSCLDATSDALASLACRPDMPLSALLTMPCTLMGCRCGNLTAGTPESTCNAVAAVQCSVAVINAVTNATRMGGGSADEHRALCGALPEFDACLKTSGCATEQTEVMTAAACRVVCGGECTLTPALPPVTTPGRCDVVGMTGCTMNFEQCAATNATCTCLAMYKSCLNTYSCYAESSEFSLATVPSLLVDQSCSMLGCDCNDAAAVTVTQCNVMGAVQCVQSMMQCFQQASPCQCIETAGSCLERYSCQDTSLIAAPLGIVSAMSQCAWAGPQFPAPTPGDACSIANVAKVMERAFMTAVSNTSKALCEVLDHAASELDALSCPGAPHDLAHLLIGSLGAAFGCSCASALGITTPIVPLGECRLVEAIGCVARIAGQQYPTPCEFFGDLAGCLKTSMCTFPQMELMAYEECTIYCGPYGCPLSPPTPSGQCDYMYHLTCAANFQQSMYPVVEEFARNPNITFGMIQNASCTAMSSLRTCYNGSECAASFVDPLLRSLDVGCTAVGCEGCHANITVQGRCQLAPLVGCSSTFAQCLSTNPSNFCECREALGVCLASAECLDNGTMITTFYNASGIYCGGAGLGSQCNLVRAAGCVYQNQWCMSSGNPCDCVETMGQCLQSAGCLNDTTSPLSKVYEDACSLAGCASCPGVTCQPGAATQCLNAAKDCVLIDGRPTCDCVTGLGTCLNSSSCSHGMIWEAYVDTCASSRCEGCQGTPAPMDACTPTTVATCSADFALCVRINGTVDPCSCMDNYGECLNRSRCLDTPSLRTDFEATCYMLGCPRCLGIATTRCSPGALARCSAQLSTCASMQMAKPGAEQAANFSGAMCPCLGAYHTCLDETHCLLDLNLSPVLGEMCQLSGCPACAPSTVPAVCDVASGMQCMGALMGALGQGTMTQQGSQLVVNSPCAAWESFGQCMTTSHCLTPTLASLYNMGCGMAQCTCSSVASPSGGLDVALATSLAAAKRGETFASAHVQGSTTFTLAELAEGLVVDVYGAGPTEGACYVITMTEGVATCPNDCSGHGICDRGVCYCSGLWSGDDCAIVRGLYTELSLGEIATIAANQSMFYLVKVPDTKMGVYEAVLEADEGVYASAQVASSTFTETRPAVMASLLVHPPLVASDSFTFEAPLPSILYMFVYASGPSGAARFHFSTKDMPCPSADCSGHGTCTRGVCICNEGFTGADCATSTAATELALNVASAPVCLGPDETARFAFSLSRASMLGKAYTVTAAPATPTANAGCIFASAGAAVQSYSACSTTTPCACLTTLLRSLVNASCSDLASTLASTACAAGAPAAGCSVCGLAAFGTAPRVAVQMATSMKDAEEGKWSGMAFPSANAATTVLSVAARTAASDLASGGLVALQARGWSLTRSCVTLLVQPLLLQCPIAPLSGAPCNNKGSCDRTTGVCTCNAGWGGADCSVDMVATSMEALTYGAAATTYQDTVGGSKKFVYVPATTGKVPFSVNVHATGLFSGGLVAVAPSTAAADRNAWKWSSALLPGSTVALVVSEASPLYVIAVIGSGAFTINLGPVIINCPDSCNGRGRCSATGVCQCAAGFVGSACQTALVGSAVALGGASVTLPAGVTKFVVDASTALGPYTIAATCAMRLDASSVTAWNSPSASSYLVSSTHPNFKGLWDGTVTPTSAAATCVVTAAYVAIVCPGQPACSNHGTCDTFTGVCSCTTGYAGADCSIDTATTSLSVLTPSSPLVSQVTQRRSVRVLAPTAALQFPVNVTLTTPGVKGGADLFIAMSEEGAEKGMWGWISRMRSASVAVQSVYEEDVNDVTAGLWISVVGAAAGTTSFTLTIAESPITCPSDCSGHGLCAAGVCTCVAGWTGDACNVAMALPPVLLGSTTTLTASMRDASGMISVLVVNTAGLPPPYKLVMTSSGDETSTLVMATTTAKMSTGEWMWVAPNDKSYELVFDPATVLSSFVVRVANAPVPSYLATSTAPRACNCSGHGSCDAISGACLCYPGFAGQKCDLALTSTPNIQPLPANTYLTGTGAQLFLLSTVGLTAPLLLDVEAVMGDPDVFVAASEEARAAGKWLVTGEEIGSERVTLTAAQLSGVPLLWIRVAPGDENAMSFRIRVRTQAAATVECADACNLHGTCQPDASCKCWQGYSGSRCQFDNSVSGVVGLSLDSTVKAVMATMSDTGLIEARLAVDVVGGVKEGLMMTITPPTANLASYEVTVARSLAAVLQGLTCASTSARSFASTLSLSQCLGATQLLLRIISTSTEAPTVRVAMPAVVLCGGHGSRVGDVCVCENGWVGANCTLQASNFPYNALSLGHSAAFSYLGSGETTYPILLTSSSPSDLFSTTDSPALRASLLVDAPLTVRLYGIPATLGATPVLVANVTQQGSVLVVVPPTARYGSYVAQVVSGQGVTVAWAMMGTMPCDPLCSSDHTTSCVAGVCVCAPGYTGSRCDRAVAVTPQVSVTGAHYVVSRVDFADGVVVQVALVSAELSGPAYAALSGGSIRRIDRVSAPSMTALSPLRVTCPNRPSVTSLPLVSRAFPLESFLRLTAPVFATTNYPWAAQFVDTTPQPDRIYAAVPLVMANPTTGTSTLMLSANELPGCTVTLSSNILDSASSDTAVPVSNPTTLLTPAPAAQCSWVELENLVERMKERLGNATVLAGLDATDQNVLMAQRNEIFSLLAVHPAWQSCVGLARSLVAITPTSVVHKSTTQCFEPRISSDGTLNAAWSTDPCCNTAALTGSQCCLPRDVTISVPTPAPVRAAVDATCRFGAAADKVLADLAVLQQRPDDAACAEAARDSSEGVYAAAQAKLAACRAAVMGVAGVGVACRADSECYSGSCRAGHCVIPVGDAAGMAAAYASCLEATLDPLLVMALKAQVDAALPTPSTDTFAAKLRAATVQSSSTCVGPTSALYAGGNVELNCTGGVCKYDVVPGDRQGCLSEKVCNWNPSLRSFDADLCTANPWGLSSPSGVCVACPPGSPCYSIGRPTMCLYPGATSAADCPSTAQWDYTTMRCFVYAAPGAACPVDSAATDELKERFMTEAECAEAQTSTVLAKQSCGVAGLTCAETPACTAPCPRCVSTKIPVGELCLGSETTAAHCLSSNGYVLTTLSTGSVVCAHNVSSDYCDDLQGTLYSCSSRSASSCVAATPAPNATMAAIESALGCAVDPLGTCATAAECATRGTCSDVELYSPYTPDGGVCVRMPVASSVAGQLTCASPADTLGMAGCINRRTSQAACTKVGGTWRRRAATQAECLAVKRCYEPALGLFTAKSTEQCTACNGAEMREVYTWTAGAWDVRPASVEWRAVRSMVPLNQWVASPMNETRLGELLRMAVGRRMAAANQNLLTCRVGRLAALVKSVACYCGGDSVATEAAQCATAEMQPLANAPLYSTPTTTSNGPALTQTVEAGQVRVLVSRFTAPASQGEGTLTLSVLPATLAASHAGANGAVETSVAATLPGGASAVYIRNGHDAIVGSLASDPVVASSTGTLESYDLCPALKADPPADASMTLVSFAFAPSAGSPFALNTSVPTTTQGGRLCVSNPPAGSLVVAVFAVPNAEAVVCPKACSGHGTCFVGTCYCDAGYSDTDCSVIGTPSPVPSKPTPPNALAIGLGAGLGGGGCVVAIVVVGAILGVRHKKAKQAQAQAAKLMELKSLDSNPLSKKPAGRVTNSA